MAKPLKKLNAKLKTRQDLYDNGKVKVADGYKRPGSMNKKKVI